MLSLEIWSALVVKLYPVELNPVEVWPVELFPLEMYAVGSYPVESYPEEFGPFVLLLPDEELRAVPEVHGSAWLTTINVSLAAPWMRSTRGLKRSIRRLGRLNRWTDGVRLGIDRAQSILGIEQGPVDCRLASGPQDSYLDLVRIHTKDS